jgi:hypothetical protein
VTALDVHFGQDSGPANLNRIRFRIADIAGNVGQSEDYDVHIDTHPLVIASGPFISGITANSATVTWQTNGTSLCSKRLIWPGALRSINV